MNSLKLLAVALLYVTATVFSITSTKLITQIGNEKERYYDAGEKKLETLIVPVGKQLKVMFDLPFGYHRFDLPGRWLLSSGHKKLPGLKYLGVTTGTRKIEINAPPTVRVVDVPVEIFSFEATGPLVLARKITFDKKISEKGKAVDSATVLYKVRPK